MNTANRDNPLTQVLLGLRLEGVEYGRYIFDRPWSVQFPAQGDAYFHFVARGHCWLYTEQSNWAQLKPGDAVLLPRGHSHTLASSPDLAPADIAMLQRTPVTDEIYVVRNHRIEDQQTDSADMMFSGTMRFNLDPLHPVLALMPDVMHGCSLAQRDPSVPVLLEAMEREVEMDRIGSCGILARLADVLAASIIRAWLEWESNCSTGWIAAVRCPKIGKVVAAIHAEPEREWSVPELAEIMGASRSRFTEAFTKTMGESPARYVAKVKMFEARRWLAQDGARIASVANRLGYDSEASFSRAFKRIIGHSPSAER